MFVSRIFTKTDFSALIGEKNVKKREHLSIFSIKKKKKSIFVLTTTNFQGIK